MEQRIQVFLEFSDDLAEELWEDGSQHKFESGNVVVEDAVAVPPLHEIYNVCFDVPIPDVLILLNANDELILCL